METVTILKFRDCKSYPLRLSVETYKRIQRCAEQRRGSVNLLINRAIQDFLKKEEVQIASEAKS